MATLDVPPIKMKCRKRMDISGDIRDRKKSMGTLDVPSTKIKCRKRMDISGDIRDRKKSIATLCPINQNQMQKEDDDNTDQNQ